MVTGATSGIGAVTAEVLARQGATVIVVGRCHEKCAAAVDLIRHKTDNLAVDFLVADLSSQSEIRRLAQQFEARYQRLDVLVNNAAGIFMKRFQTVDGIEMTFALNHLAYFLLTKLLLDLIKASAPARIINVSSCGHELMNEIRFDDLQGRRNYRGFKAYHQSKLANLLFTYELARRLEGTGVTVNALHPGIVATNIGKNNGWGWRLLKPLFDPLFHMKYISPEEGARTVIYLATSPEVEGTTGRYFVEEKPIVSSQASRDEAAADRLWQVCDEMTTLPFTS
ncbi:MAG: SDR family oxidoreductase [bacterium]